MGDSQYHAYWHFFWDDYIVISGIILGTFGLCGIIIVGL